VDRKGENDCQPMMIASVLPLIEPFPVLKFAHAALPVGLSGKRPAVRMMVPRVSIP